MCKNPYWQHFTGGTHFRRVRRSEPSWGSKPRNWMTAGIRETGDCVASRCQSFRSCRTARRGPPMVVGGVRRALRAVRAAHLAEAIQYRRVLAAAG